MKPCVLFVIIEPYADWESAFLSSAIQELGDQQIEVKTVSLDTKPVKTIGGFTTLPDYRIEESPDGFLAVILVGGDSWKRPEAQRVIPLLDKAVKHSRVIGGICAGSEFLAANGYVNAVNHTSNGLESIREWNPNKYTNAANYLNQQSVRDGLFVTANGTASLDFTRDVLLALAVFPEASIDEWYEFEKLGYVEMVKGQG